MKLDILAIGVHPDDVELSCSGTLFKEVSHGKKIGILDLTQGELGTRGTPETRYQEATEAAKIMKLSVRINLKMQDGFFQNTPQNQLQIIQIIRYLKPEVVLANAIDDRHPDHGRAAKLVHDAVFYSGLKKIETEWEGTPQEAWRPKTLFHYIQDKHLDPDFVIDITPYIESKIECIKAYKTQFYDPNSTEPQTPISGQDFLDFVLSRSRTIGRSAGFEYGEGFTSSKKIGIHRITDVL
jgi:bacillithiol biosynthesis deacetylase BshB1